MSMQKKINCLASGKDLAILQEREIRKRLRRGIGKR